jgi:hypothetical protein
VGVLQSPKTKIVNTPVCYTRDLRTYFWKGGGAIRFSSSCLRRPSTFFISRLKEEKKVAFV